jgi:phosphoglycerol transferase MdoB-like AlkP superfamily enzyme
MSSMTAKLTMLACGVACIAYLAVLLAHELGRIDLSGVRILHLHDESGMRRKGRVRRLWALIALTAMTLVFLPLGLIVSSEYGPLYYAIFVVVECIYARSDRARERLRAHFAKVSPAKAHAQAVAMSVVLCWLALEVPTNDQLWVIFTRPAPFVIEFGTITAVVLVFWFVGQRRRLPLTIAAALFFAIGTVEYFVVLFKQMPVLPSDLLALGTAAAVSGGYVYSISGSLLLGLACVIAVGWVTSCCEEWGNGGKRSRIAVNLAVAVSCVAALVLGYTQVRFTDDLGIIVRAWCPLYDYQEDGFITAFATGVQNAIIEVPDGYTKEGAEELVKKYAAEYDEGRGSSEARQAAEQQFEETKPNIIVIMDETFSDLSIYDGLGVGYEGPKNFNSIDDALMQGTLYVSAYGGGTCNTEFEFLTGVSMNYFGQSVYPYSVYNMEGVPNLVQELEGYGYQTTAMHPNLPTNWNRESVYSTFGFDQFLSLDYFESKNSSTLRDFVTDDATFDTALDIINSSDQPQFIFDVTMQNHSGYKTGKLPSSLMTDYSFDGLSDEDNLEVNEYLSLINQSDQALADLLDELRASDEPTIVVFFGDHQPYFPDTFNDKLMNDSDEATHTFRLWSTKYLIWANYDVAGSDSLDSDQDLSTNYLAAAMLDAIGAPLTDYQKANLALHDHLTAINVIGYETDGSFYFANPGDPGYDYYQDLEKMQYMTFFDYKRKNGLWLISSGPGVTDPTQQ